MKNEDAQVYKGVEKAKHNDIDKESLKASEILYRRLSDVIRSEDDRTDTVVKPIRRHFGRYASVSESGSGSVIKKVLIPDSTAQGKGYHSVTIVACAARLKSEVEEAVKEATQVKTKVERVGGRITKETVVVLSKELPFKDANKARSIGSTRLRSVQVFSVQNAIGVAKVVLNKLANLFDIRSQKILGARNVWGELKEFGITLGERAKLLSKQVVQLGQALREGGFHAKKAVRRVRAMAWARVQQAREWGVRFYTSAADLTDLRHVQDIINAAAKRQNIDVWSLESRKWRSEVEATGVLDLDAR
jgi:hypothetical protein